MDLLFGRIEREGNYNGIRVATYSTQLRDENEALKEWGIAHYGGAWFRPNPDRMISFRSGPYQTAEEATAARDKWFEEVGYTKPRWWQWWRWDEPRY